MNAKMMAHEVEAHRIVELGPLQQRGGGIVPVHLGLALILDDRSTKNWVRDQSDESDGPNVGDFYVEDATVGLNYIVPGAKFANLFEVEKDPISAEHERAEELVAHGSLEQVEHEIANSDISNDLLPALQTRRSELEALRYTKHVEAITKM